jgi:TPR repeat protein
MRRILLAASIAATGLAGSAIADQDWQTMDFQDWRLMLRDAHAAYEREDYEKAAERYVVTACMGDKNSQFALGSMYLMGHGVPADALKAYAWYKVASESREPDYLRAYERLDKVIPAEHRATAEAMAAQYLTDFGERATGVNCERRAEAGTKISRLECKPPIDPRTGKIEVKAVCLADGG